MGIMKRIGIYNAPKNYQDPQQIAMQKYLEKKEKENLEEKLLTIAFKEWEKLLLNLKLIPF